VNVLVMAVRLREILNRQTRNWAGWDPIFDIRVGKSNLPGHTRSSLHNKACIALRAVVTSASRCHLGCGRFPSTIS
jgi:hypothetical protein